MNEAAEHDAADGEFVVEGHDFGVGDEGGDLAGGEGRAVEAVFEGVLVAGSAA